MALQGPLDFDASIKDRPVPARDKATSELMRSVPVLDGDPSLEAAAKLAAAYSCKATGMRAARSATLTNAKRGGPKDAE